MKSEEKNKLMDYIASLFNPLMDAEKKVMINMLGESRKNIEKLEDLNNKFRELYLKEIDKLDLDNMQKFKDDSPSVYKVNMFLSGELVEEYKQKIKSYEN
jgi:hypothetical protein